MIQRFVAETEKKYKGRERRKEKRNERKGKRKGCEMNTKNWQGRTTQEDAGRVKAQVVRMRSDK